MKKNNRGEIHLREKAAFYKKLFSIVLPLALQYLMSAIVSASDAVMLGFLNQDSLSAVSLATQVQFVLNLFYVALTIGTTILAAQYWGKGDIPSVEKNARHRHTLFHADLLFILCVCIRLPVAAHANIH